MKKLILTNIQEGVRRLGAVKAMFEHMENAYVESMADILYGIVASSNGPVKLYGVVNSGSGANYIISAGAIWYNGEIYKINAFTGTASGADVPVLSLVETKTQLPYSDNTNQDTLNTRTHAWAFGATGTGLADFSALVTLKDRINTNLLDVPGQITAGINALIAAAPGALDTLDELAAALGDDANFASTVTTALAGKVSTSRAINTSGGLQGGGDLSADRTISIADDGVTTAKILDGNVTDAKLASKFLKAADSVQLLSKVIEIGDWNMDSTADKTVAHGITFSKVRAVAVVLRSDDAANEYVLPVMATDGTGDTLAGVSYVDSTNVNLHRKTASFFDNANFDATSFNRGWVTIIYEA